MIQAAEETETRALADLRRGTCAFSRNKSETFHRSTCPEQFA